MEEVIVFGYADITFNYKGKQIEERCEPGELTIDTDFPSHELKEKDLRCRNCDKIVCTYGEMLGGDDKD